MSEGDTFEMDIKNVFSFADGRTVLVGTVAHGPHYIGRQQCELLIDGVPASVIEIEGEMIPDTSQPGKLRSLSTRDHIAVDHSLLSTAKCRLKSLTLADAHHQNRIGKTA